MPAAAAPGAVPAAGGAVAAPGALGADGAAAVPGAAPAAGGAAAVAGAAAPVGGDAEDLYGIFEQPDDDEPMPMAAAPAVPAAPPLPAPLAAVHVLMPDVPVLPPIDFNVAGFPDGITAHFDRYSHASGHLRMFLYCNHDAHKGHPTKCRRYVFLS